MISLGIFPKFLRGLAPDLLAEQLAARGLNAVDAVIRDGYWTPRHALNTSLPAFIRSMQQCGLQCDSATWADAPQSFLDAETELGILADTGIRSFRMGYFRQADGQSWIDCLSQARQELERIATLCAKHQLRVVYQVHHGTAFTSPEGAAALCADMPENVGIMLDVGNQGFEGRCDFKRADAILGERWTDLCVKDVRIVNRQTQYAPCQEGSHQWSTIAQSWLRRNRPGRWNLQPFYHENDSTHHLETLAEEVAFLRQAERDL